MHINVKPVEHGRVYETPEQAIQHLFLFSVYADKWDDGRAFGQKMNDMRRVNSAIKVRDFSAFIALKRRGYWRVELA